MLPNVIDKCLASTRALTRSRALEVVMTYIELELADAVLVGRLISIVPAAYVLLEAV